MYTRDQRDIMAQWLDQYNGIKKDPVEIVSYGGNTTAMMGFLQTLPADCRIAIATPAGRMVMWEIEDHAPSLIGRVQVLRDLTLLGSDCDVLYLEDMEAPKNFKGKVISCITVVRPPVPIPRWMSQESCDKVKKLFEND